MRRDHFAFGNLHALTGEPGTVHLELAAVGALHRRRFKSTAGTRLKSA
jgi:hypothetical protein